MLFGQVNLPSEKGMLTEDVNWNKEEILSYAKGLVTVKFVFGDVIASGYHNGRPVPEGKGIAGAGREKYLVIVRAAREALEELVREGKIKKEEGYMGRYLTEYYRAA